MNLFILIFNISICYIDFVFTLRDVKIITPIATQKSEMIRFICNFDLEGDPLYSVKWYKGRREFYRFTPKENPNIKIFPTHGIQIAENLSNRSHLVLTNVQFSTSGKYSCEVSADAPSFHTSLVSEDVLVVDLPKENPVIFGVRLKYRIGDIVRVTCTSKNSKPAANLTWFINNEKAKSEYLSKFNIQKKNNGYESSHLELQFVLIQNHFIHGKLIIRCEANIFNIYLRTVEKILEHEPNSFLNYQSSIIPQIFLFDSDKHETRYVANTFYTNRISVFLITFYIFIQFIYNIF